MSITPLECLLFSELGSSICCWTMERSPLSLFICLIYPPLNMKGESSMSEAIITRRGSNGSGGKGNLVTQTFTTNTSFNVPATGNYQVRIFGGGGGADSSAMVSGGGGGGWMNNGEFTLSAGSIIPITIGKGGNHNGQSGGTSSFGVYISANGGSSGNDVRGGNGGAGGGGAIDRLWYLYIGAINAGVGYLWGGGGGRGGNGGPYGGSGGGYTVAWNNTNTTGSNYTQISAGVSTYANGVAGQYGGNGGIYVNNLNGRNGTNTIGNDEVETNLQGNGKGGIGYRGSSIGGNACMGGGGGGGYGGIGGNSARSIVSNHYSMLWGGDYIWQNRRYAVSAGGGGGYGGKGGNGDEYGCGGGGGYGGNGGNGGGNYGGGGGSYGNGASHNTPATFGGGGSNGYNGADGICIIQYYA